MTPLNETQVLIPASSRRQAMDWSLVLMSQGVEPVIEQREHGWGLLIDARDQERALETIRRYRMENRGWLWRRQPVWPSISLHPGVLAWCLFLVGFYWMSTVLNPRLGDAGVMDSRAVSNGAWWRIFTAITLHVDLGHLAANLAAGFWIIGLAMGRFGPGVALLAAYLAGAGGNLAGLLLHAQPYRGLGASGMVMGALGLLATQSLVLRRGRPIPARYVVSGLGAAIMLFVLLGSDPKSDVAAHLGGLVSGLLIGCLLAIIPTGKLRSSRANALAGALWLVLVALTWSLALR